MKTLIIALLLLTGCAQSLIPGHYREATYRGPSMVPWKIHIADQYTVWWKCFPVPAAYGCTDPKTHTVWAIDSLAILLHECDHVHAIEEGTSELVETVKDLAYGWAIGNAMFAATLPFPALERPCGEDYVEGDKTRWVRLKAKE